MNRRGFAASHLWRTQDKSALSQPIVKHTIRLTAAHMQVLSFSRLTKGGWAKIAHHLGRSGPSAVQNITSKSRILKKQAGTDASSNALFGQALQGTCLSKPLACATSVVLVWHDAQ